MMQPEVLVALVSLCGTLCGTFAGILTSTKLMTFRIEQLESKVEKHNSVVGRTYMLEKDMENVLSKIDDLKKEEENIDEKLQNHLMNGR